MIYGACGREKRREIARYLNITEEKDQRLFETTNLKKLIIVLRITSARIPSNDNSVRSYVRNRPGIAEACVGGFCPA